MGVASNWLNTGLYTLELVNACTYFATYRDDPTWTRCLEAFSLLCDTISTLTSYAVLYLVSQSGRDLASTAIGGGNLADPTFAVHIYKLGYA